MLNRFNLLNFKEIKIKFSTLMIVNSYYNQVIVRNQSWIERIQSQNKSTLKYMKFLKMKNLKKKLNF